MVSSYHFVGVAGSGMRPLAALLVSQGNAVTGSDREFDKGRAQDVRDRLCRAGIEVLSQDGSGPGRNPQAVVVSAAIEESNPDIIAARRWSIPIVRRAELLAQALNAGRTIGVAGTNGKTTVSAMTTWVLQASGRGCTSIVGAGLLNFPEGSIEGFVAGGDGLLCAEVDESDGTVLLCKPAVGIVTNVGKDHKEVDELMSLFASFCRQVSELVVTGYDCPRARRLEGLCPRVTFGLQEGADVHGVLLEGGLCRSLFEVDGARFVLQMPGAHNVSNALAAIAVARHLGIPDAAIADALSAFKGVARRLQRVGQARGVRVIDDYAHNPYKIAASVAAMKAGSARVLGVYQPHGFGPTRFMMNELVQSLAEAFPAPHRLSLLPVYDAGGTADRSVSSDQLADLTRAAGGCAESLSDRATLIRAICGEAREGDTVLVMGARDNTLTDLCRDILNGLGKAR